MVFAERFPYWSSPFNNRLARDFKVGDRVLNLNSQMRQYVPFGLRGTVIGRTDDKVMVMFDDQFIGGNDLFNQCEQYRGVFVNPNYLLNLTKKFESAQKKKADNSAKITNMFTERDPDQPQQVKEEERKVSPVEEKKEVKEAPKKP
jgi:hypothetical protein